MALSNIFNEPRREITETVIGIILFIPFVGLDYWTANKILEWGNCAYKTNNDFPCAPFLLEFLLISPIFLFFCIVGIIFISIIIHGLGNLFCDFLENRGIYLRPRNRR